MTRATGRPGPDQSPSVHTEKRHPQSDTRPVTRAEQAYRRILLAILHGELPRGEFLSQRKLAEMTGTSVISVRESLQRLENEGLLEMVPRWGVRIPLETRERLIDRYTIREALEVMAAYLIASKPTDHYAARLRELAKHCDEIQRDPQHVVDFAEYHRQFHLYLAECSGIPGLRRELERISMTWLIYRSAETSWVRQLESETPHWHSELADNILSGDTSRAEEAMHRHIRHGLVNDMASFESRSNGTTAEDA